jgi:hypothetical protein
VGTPTATPAPAPHPAINWGIFLGLLAMAIQKTGQVLAPDHPAVAAAMSGGAQVLGDVDQALLASEAETTATEQPGS